MKLILVFLLVSSSEQLQCLTNSFEKFQFSTSSSFNWTNIENLIDRNTSFDEHITWCQVQLIMNYNKQILEIILNPLYSSDDSNFSTISTVIATFTLNNKQSSTVIELPYACQLSLCDRNFIRKNYLQLVKKNFIDFQYNLTKLLVKENNSTLICVNNLLREHTEMCNNTPCTAEYSISALPDFSKQLSSRGCADNNQNLTILKITTRLYKKLNYITKNVYYTCMYNECNNNSTTNAIHNLIQTSFSASCILDDSCFYINENDRPTTLTMEIVSSLDKNTARKSYYQFSNLIKSIFMFSFLFCFSKHQ